MALQAKARCGCPADAVSSVMGCRTDSRKVLRAQRGGTMTGDLSFGIHEEFAGANGGQSRDCVAHGLVWNSSWAMGCNGNSRHAVFACHENESVPYLRGSEILGRNNRPWFFVVISQSVDDSQKFSERTVVATLILLNTGNVFYEDEVGFRGFDKTSE